MATFIVQGRYSGEAMKGLIARPEDRKAAAAKLFEAAGAKLKDYYVTTGDKDFLVVVEASDGEKVVAAVVAAASAGGVSDVVTSRAWTAAEFKKICEKAATAAGAYRAPGAPG